MTRPRSARSTCADNRPTIAGEGRLLPALAVHGAPLGRPERSNGNPSPVSSGTSGSRNARLRCTGPGDRQRRLGQRSAEDRTPVTRCPGVRFGCPHLVEPADEVAVQLDLIGRLVGARRPQLRRSVGREDDQRDATVGGLDDRWIEVRRRTSRGGDDRDRLAVERAIPSARNAAERSSCTTCSDRRSSSARAIASAAERDPGARHACSIPLRTSSSTRTSASAWEGLAAFIPRPSLAAAGRSVHRIQVDRRQDRVRVPDAVAP